MTRAARDEAKGLLRQGRDPNVQKKIDKLTSKRSAANTFEAVAREWHDLQKERWVERHAQDVIQSLENDVFPHIGKLPLCEISSVTVLGLLRLVEARPAKETARRLRQRISSIFVYAISSGIRANARRVTLSADYSKAKNCAYRRFIRVHYPSRGLVEAKIEITSTVSLDLRNMRVSFSGIVVPEALYPFDAATEEGAPGQTIEPIESGGVDTPTGFTVSVQNEVVSGGSTAAFLLGEWADYNSNLRYEMEYERTIGSTGAQSAFAGDGEDFIRSGYLVDGQQYRVRLRAWGGGTPSEWTDYILVTATADPVPPGPVTVVSVDVSTPGEALFQWTAPNSSNYFACRIFINTVDDLGTATLVATEYGPPSAVDLRTITSLTPGTYYGWLRSINPSGVMGTVVATGSFTVT